jgi:hypothetical protein
VLRDATHPVDRLFAETLERSRVTTLQLQAGLTRRCPSVGASLCACCMRSCAHR